MSDQLTTAHFEETIRLMYADVERLARFACVCCRDGDFPPPTINGYGQYECPLCKRTWQIVLPEMVNPYD